MWGIILFFSKISANYPISTVNYAIDIKFSPVTSAAANCASECEALCTSDANCTSWYFSAGCYRSACTTVQLASSAGKTVYSKGTQIQAQLVRHIQILIILENFTDFVLLVYNSDFFT